jgi:hypothetical protein
LSHSHFIISASQLAELSSRKVISLEGASVLNAAEHLSGIEIHVPATIQNMQTFPSNKETYEDPGKSTKELDALPSKKVYKRKGSALDFIISHHGVEIPKVSPYVWHINNQEDLLSPSDDEDDFGEGQDQIIAEYST